jgi:type IV pilus assembly protein PilX
MNQSSCNKPGHEGGAALIVTLIVLVIVTLLALASLRGTLLQERMSGNLYDRELAFQAAETALREAEARIQANATAFDCDCSDKACSLPPPPNEDCATDWHAATTALGPLVDDSPPQYYIERMGEGPIWGAEAECDGGADANQYGSRCWGYLAPLYFRITARSAPIDGRAAVTLQVMVRRRPD